jgi:hypothetical protein
MTSLTPGTAYYANMGLKVPVNVVQIPRIEVHLVIFRTWTPGKKKPKKSNNHKPSED